MKNFFSRLRQDPGLPMNDARVLYWWTTVAEVMFAIALTIAAVEYSPFRLAGLEVLAILFVALHFFGSTYGAIYYPDKHTLELERKLHRTGTKSLFRRGEILNALFTGYVGLIVPLMVTWGILFTIVPGTSFMVAQTSVAILTTFSIAKMIRVPSEQRKPHNSVLFWMAMAVTTTAAIMLIGEAFFGRPPVFKGIVDLYTVIVVSYAAHNTAFSLLCPDFKTRRPGHLIGFAFVLMIMVIAFLYALGANIVLPATLAQFAIRTAAIMVIGFVLSYFFRDPARGWREKKAGKMLEQTQKADKDAEG